MKPIRQGKLPDHDGISVIEHLDELKKRCVRLLGRLEPLRMHQLILQRAEEAFNDGVVEAVALATHAGDYTMLCQQRW
jgi:hypothetical protein